MTVRSLAARLVHSHSGLSPDKDLEQLSRQGLDRRRLTRLGEYIDANLEGGISRSPGSSEWAAH